MRTFLGFLLGIALIIPITSGCGPSLTEEDLGTVVFDVGQLPGADVPYELPDSSTTAPSESKNTTTDGS
ncbi:MAG: hypothetical protein A2V98_13205 [Planctomycetes bacterium RBG_16_64_12]|nr:MAG: hypothetical protein A2V98_13205 [Planctomycetes bacterium RBG_16_64_12]